MITNKNEITKSDFDKLNEVKDFDIFSPQQIGMLMANLNSLVKKGEVDELNEEEIELIKAGTAEFKNLTKYTINEMIENRIVKSDIYVQPKQVKWLDIIEKSETGEKIEKGIYLDTPLNQELGRVGITFEKGKKAVKKADKEETEEKDEDYDEDMMKSASEYVSKGGMEKKDMYKGMVEKYPKGDKDMMKKCLNKAYKNMSDDYMKKANIEIEIGDDDEDKKEEETEKGKK